MHRQVLTIGISGAVSAADMGDYILVLSKMYDLNVILTEQSKKFISEQLLKYYIKNVFSDNFEKSHIELGQSCDLFIVMPATANIIGKIANGIADDLLSSTAIACNKPKILVPNMNNVMWNSAPVQSNIEKIKGYGYNVIVNSRKSLEVCTNEIVENETGLPSVKELIRIVNDSLN